MKYLKTYISILSAFKMICQYFLNMDPRNLKTLGNVLY